MASANTEGVQKLVSRFVRRAEEENFNNFGTNYPVSNSIEPGSLDEAFEIIFNLGVQVYQDPKYHPEVQKLLRIVENKFLRTGQVIKTCLTWIYEICAKLGQKLLEISKSKWLKIALFLLISSMALIMFKKAGFGAGMEETGLSQLIGDIIAPELALGPM